jgi:methionyl-tRNA formyltransferase
MSRVRILFLGTPGFAVASLKRLIDDEHFEIVAVVSQPDRPAGRKMQLKASPVKELALAHGLPVFTPETVNTEEFRAKIAEFRAESAVVVAFGQILGQKFLDLFPKGCVNVHGSLLPRWRGAAPIQRAVMAGDTETGVALQIVVRKLDAGPLLGVRRLALDDSMNALELHDALKELGADLLHVEYMDYLRGNLTPLAQDESLVTIAPKIEKSEAQIDWSLSAREVHNKVRGLQMGPFASSTLDGRAVKIHRTMIVSESGASGEPGQIISQHASGFHVACGAGVVDVLEVQPESKPRMTAAAFAKGYLANSAANAVAKSSMRFQ